MEPRTKKMEGMESTGIGFGEQVLDFVLVSLSKPLGLCCIFRRLFVKVGGVWGLGFVGRRRCLGGKPYLYCVFFDCICVIDALAFLLIIQRERG